MGDVNLEIKLSNLDERVIKIEESGGSGGDGYITSVSNDFNVVNKKLSLSNDVTTKLSKVDTTDNLSVELDKKIDKPSSAIDGQVLTYNGTSNEWEAKNPSASITEPTELEKGIIGGDEYSETETYGTNDGLKNVCIHNNKIYSAKQESFSNIEPTVASGWEDYWEETSISALNSKLSSVIDVTSAVINLNGYVSLQKYGKLVALSVFNTNIPYDKLVINDDKLKPIGNSFRTVIKLNHSNSIGLCWVDVNGKIFIQNLSGSQVSDADCRGTIMWFVK